jgi:hypothetical protein
MSTIKITLSFQASKSFQNELKMNNIPFHSNTLTSYILNDSPKIQMAIRMTKERFGSQSLKITNL